MITPTVLASGVCDTSTTVREKFGSLSEGLATSNRPLAGRSCCAAAGAASNTSNRAATRNTLPATCLLPHLCAVESTADGLAPALDVPGEVVQDGLPAA